MIDLYALADDILEGLGYEDIPACAAEFSARIPEEDLRDVLGLLARDLFRNRLGQERRAADNGGGAPNRSSTKRPQRKKGARRAEVSAFVRDFCLRWLDSKSGVSGDEGYKRRGDFTVDDWAASSEWKYRQASTYSRQAQADEQLASAMSRNFVTRTDELGPEALFQIIKSYDDLTEDTPESADAAA